MLARLDPCQVEGGLPPARFEVRPVISTRHVGTEGKLLNIPNFISINHDIKPADGIVEVSKCSPSGQGQFRFALHLEFRCMCCCFDITDQQLSGWYRQMTMAQN